MRQIMGGVGGLYCSGVEQLTCQSSFSGAVFRGLELLFRFEQDI